MDGLAFARWAGLLKERFPSMFRAADVWKEGVSCVGGQDSEYGWVVSKEELAGCGSVPS